MAACNNCRTRDATSNRVGDYAGMAHCRGHVTKKAVGGETNGFQYFSVPASLFQEGREADPNR